jgi:hypothetical protein
VAVSEQQQTVRAQAKWVRMSARKGRVVAEHIRGRSVPEARAVLAFTQRAAAREIEKVLASVANAERTTACPATTSSSRRGRRRWADDETLARPARPASPDPEAPATSR